MRPRDFWVAIGLIALLGSASIVVFNWLAMEAGFV